MHVVRKWMWGYTALYRAKNGERVLVRSLSAPPAKRKFKVAGGLRTFKRIKQKRIYQEVVIVAKAAKKSKKSTVVTDDEIDELEGIDELEDDDDLDEDEDEDEDDEPEDEADEDEDDDDEDDEEEEKPKKKAKKKTQSQAAKNGFVGSNEVAEHVGAKDARELRMVLRKLREKDDAFAPDEETGRYQWKSLKDPQVVKIKKAFEKGLHKKIKDESLARLKERNAEKKAAKDAGKKTKKSGAKKKKKAPVEDDDE